MARILAIIVSILFLQPEILLVRSYKILCVFPTFSKSHLIIASGLMKGLTEFGHDVTVLSSFPLEEPVKNYRDVVVPANDIRKKIQQLVIKLGNISPFEKLFLMNKISELGLKLANESLHVPEFQKIMKEESFDLVILGMFCNQFLSGLAAHFKCPLAVVNQIATIEYTNSLVGNPSSVATVPTVLSGIAGRNMNFWDRLKNYLSYTVDYLNGILRKYHDRHYYRANFPSDKYPSYDQMLKNVSLVLINHHFSQGIPQAYVPAMVEIGGIHLKNKPSPLPQKIQDWLDGADEGVILFSFGTNIGSSKLSPEILDAILTTFSKLKQRILFKWEIDNLPHKPDNVMVGKWLPQEDILAHNNTRIFISHGGKGSLVESQFHAVPVIGIPIFADQTSNVKLAVQEGWAIKIEFLDLTEAKLSAAINEMLTNSKYKESVQKIALLFRDRPMTAQETANYWVEYVIRHRGAPHLQSPAVHLNFLQYHSLDVIALIVISLYSIFKVIQICAKFIDYQLRRILKKNQKNKIM